MKTSTHSSPTASGVLRRTRPLTSAEINVVCKPGEPQPWEPWRNLLSAALIGVPGLGLAALVFALVLHRSLLPGQSITVLAVLCSITGVIAAWLLFEASRKIKRAIMRPRPTPARMTREMAAAVTVDEITATVDRVWDVFLGDVDESALLARSGDRFVWVRMGSWLETWEELRRLPADRAIGREISIVLLEREVISFTQSGERLRIEEATLDSIGSDGDGQSARWFEDNFRELTIDKLGEKFVKRHFATRGEGMPRIGAPGQRPDRTSEANVGGP